MRGARARWAALTGIAAALVLAVALAARFGTDPTVVASPLIGREVPPLELPYLEEEGALSLAELEGEVAVINFWASWCLECRIEHGDLIAAAERYRPAGVRFVGILFNDRSGPAVDFLDELGRGYEYVTDPGARAAIEFGVFGVPETFVLDPEGRIAAKITGPSSLELLSGTIERVFLGETPGLERTGPVRSEPGDS